MAMKNLIMKCKVNFAKALCFFLIISQDPSAFRMAQPVDAVMVRSKSACVNKILNDFKGVIYSPNYPSPYPEDVECQWRIRAPSNTILKIDIKDLNITEDENCQKLPCCTEHRLTIFREGEPIVLCGNQTVKRPITVYQPITTIKYYSSRNNCEGRGFKLVYSMQRHTCKANQFPCMDGKCHLKSKFCNGFDVCRDGSDEAYCYHVSHTRNYESVRKEILSNEYRGFNYERMKKRWICNDGSVRCSLSPGYCFFPSTDICDGKYDCPRGEDEIGCNPLCPKLLACANNQGCYSPVHRCNGFNNCKDKSDEFGCAPQPCIAMEFTCLNGACILGSEVCDGDDDCGDYSDEEHCPRASFVKIAVVSLLTCIILFSVFLACMYYMYTIRLRTPSNFVHHLEAEPIEDDFLFRDPPPSYSVAINDPRMLTYSSPEVAERFFDADNGLRFHATRGIRRHRRHPLRGNTESASAQRGSGRRIPVPGRNNFNSEPKVDDSDKTYNRENCSEFQQQLESRGLVRTLQDEPVFEPGLPFNLGNDSSSSSSSSSPSRESLTSCTSLEEIDDVVTIFHR